LDRFEQYYQCKPWEEESLMYLREDTLKNELKSQKKHVRNLEKESLWSKFMEEGKNIENCQKSWS
jgi:hypothetical protein